MNCIYKKEELTSDLGVKRFLNILKLNAFCGVLDWLSVELLRKVLKLFQAIPLTADAGCHISEVL